MNEEFGGFFAGVILTLAVGYVYRMIKAKKAAKKGSKGSRAPSNRVSRR